VLTLIHLSLTGFSFEFNFVIVPNWSCADNLLHAKNSNKKAVTLNTMFVYYVRKI